jgi:FkbM family methyltransferase
MRSDHASGTARNRENSGDLATASPLKIKVGQFLAGDKAGRVIGAMTGNRVRHQGLWFDVGSSDFSPSVRAMMFWGSYEGAETRMIRSLLGGSPAVVELGSSLGITAAHVAATMPSQGQLICVEANPCLVRGLRVRIPSRAPSLRVQVIHAAISDHCGTAQFVIAEDTLGSRVGTPRPRESVVEVPALTLQEVLRRADVGEFNLISDIEGAEAAFLLNDPKALDKCRRAVIEFHDAEFGGRQHSISDLIEATLALGFRIVSRHGPVLALDRP